ncbi:MAG: hypothetical protein PHQ23_12500, partial [Candidatus Wallbacteria bacterium]|nr:hypothetical protein [Candidatus Wallbacteria bacterium]
MIVMKFGGTSVGNPESIRNVCRLIEKNIARRPAVVVSAVSGVTDMLLRLAGTAAATGAEITQIRNKHQQIISDLALDKHLLDQVYEHLLKDLAFIAESLRLTKRMQDKIASYGEKLSVRLVSACLDSMGLKSRFFESPDIGFVTDEHFTEAEILPETYSLIPSKFRCDDAIPVVTGFIGRTIDGDITTLGRSGSDYTAAILGSALGAEEIQIWTDVSGVKT